MNIWDDYDVANSDFLKNQKMTHELKKVLIWTMYKYVINCKLIYRPCNRKPFPKRPFLLLSNLFIKKN